MSMPNVCVDTNVWFYALARPTTGETARHDAGRALISGIDHPVITPQIVNELACNLLRKRSWSEAELRDLVADDFPDSELHPGYSG